MTYLVGATAFLQNPTWDVVMILFFLAAGFFGGAMSGGRAKLQSFILGLYVALLLAPSSFRFLDAYGIAPKSAERNIGAYLVLVIAAFLILERRALRALPRGAYPWWQAVIMSFLATGLFMSGGLYLISFKGIAEFSALTQALFVGANAYLFWSFAPLAGLFLFSRK